MKKWLCIALLVTLAIGCKAETKNEQEGKASAPALESTGIVQSSQDVSNYTYLEIKGKDTVYWAAVPKTVINKGDTVELVSPTLMQNFEAKTLGRKFDKIIFAGGVIVNGKTPDVATPADQKASEVPQKQKDQVADVSMHMQADKAIDASDVKKADTGVTIADILAKSAAYTDKKVVLRGKVVKFLPEIMKKNWLHLKDASVKDKDIVATTQENFKVGDVVVVEGTVKTNQDFGFGYKYDVLLDEVKKK
jgi:hypothetical protein